DVTGHPAVLAQALPLARRHGAVVLIGDAGSPQLQSLTSDVITRGVHIVGVHDAHPPLMPTRGIRWSDAQMCQLFLSYLARGEVRVDDLVSHRYAPTAAAEMYTMLQKDRGSAMGVVIDWAL
nr:hypothetical protein [Planctomycetota bacterium]